MDNQKNNFSQDSNFEFDKNSELDVLFRNTLKNNSIPTEDHVWRRIKHGLADKKGETPITKTITKRSYLPVWSAASGIAASLLVWFLFFAPSTKNDLNTNSIANSDKIEIGNELNKNETENLALADNSQSQVNSESYSANNAEKNNQKIQNEEATSSNAVASKVQQTPSTITIKNTVPDNHSDRAVASLEKDQTRIKKQEIPQRANQKVNTKTFDNPSTQIAENVWTSDFVVHNSNYSSSFSVKKEKNNADIHQLNLDNQTVAITIKVGKNDNMMSAGQSAGFDANQNSSQFDKAKSVLKEVWNLKTGKKVNLQNILPNNENENQNEKATDKTTTTQSNSHHEIQAD